MKNRRGFTLVELPVASRRGRSAFTLVELLVVAAIIGMLVTIAMPALGRALWLARRATCGTQIGNALKGMRLYVAEYDGRYPTCGYGFKTKQFDVIGADIHQDPDTADSNSRNLFLAVRTGFVDPDLMLCPAVKGTEVAHVPNKQDGLHYDFDVGVDDGGTVKYVEKLSYSFHLQFSPRENGPKGYQLVRTSDNGMAVLADKNPHVTYRDNEFNGGFKAEEPITMGAEANSFNHRYGTVNEGQNVGYPDGHAVWKTDPEAGVNDDNIYTVWDGKDIRGGKISESSMPQGRTDSFLVP
ncbi:MAG: type II secretion system protein [Planctomycetota bacterium]|jgi:prepilin-type N-terminal cleavage/methylation domain-containing protein